jgi:hypothetical protein
MPTLRERFANVLLGPEYRDLKAASTAIWSSYEKRPYWVSSDQLKELDARTLELIARHYGDISLAGPFSGEADEEAARKRAVSDSRHLYRADVVTQRIIGLWTDFGFGQTIEVKPRDDQLLEDWKEFETAERNRPVLKPRKIQRLSDLLLVEGELFLPFFINKLDGTCTVRRFNPDQITEIITSPEDEDIVLYYKREWTRKGEAQPNVLYYKDWQADADELNDIKLPDKAQLADTQRENTDVMMLHVAHHTLSIRGWPLMDAAFPWVRTYKEFLQNRAAVARAVAMIVDKITARTGSRGVEAIRRKLESTLNNAGQTAEQNPAAIAGSTWIENEAATRQRMPLGTGASDAQVDGGALLAMVGLGGGVFAHWLGRGEAFRLATATAMEQPVMRQWQRYQSFWADAWRDMVGLVRKGGELYGGKTYSEVGVDVSTDALIQVDLRYLAGALSQARMQEFVPVEVAMEKFLQALGVKNVSEILAQAKVEREEKAKIDQEATALARAAGAEKARNQGIATPGGNGANAAALARQAKVPAGGDGGEDGE